MCRMPATPLEYLITCMHRMSVSPTTTVGASCPAIPASSGGASNLGPASLGRIKWLSDLEKFVLLSNFERRGWIKGSSEGRSICNN